MKRQQRCSRNAVFHYRGITVLPLHRYLSRTVQFVLTGLGQLKTVGNVDNLLILVQFEGGRADVVVSLHLIAERRVRLWLRLHVKQRTCK